MNITYREYCDNSCIAISFSYRIITSKFQYRPALHIRCVHTMKIMCIESKIVCIVCVYRNAHFNHSSPCICIQSIHFQRWFEASLKVNCTMTWINAGAIFCVWSIVWRNKRQGEKSRIASPFFSWGPCTKSVQSAGKEAGYTRLRSGHTRLEEPQLKEVNTQSIPCCKDWISEVSCSAGNMANWNHIKQMPLNWILWSLLSNPRNLIRKMFWWKSNSRIFSHENYPLYGSTIA